jgi:hypothetical protein
MRQFKGKVEVSNIGSVRSELKLKLPTSSPTFHAYSRTRTSAEPWDVSKNQQGTGVSRSAPV